MSSLKESILLLVAVVCSILFIVNVIDIVFHWPDTGFNWMYLGKKVLYASVTGYWVWRLLIMPYRKRTALEAENHR